MQTKRFLSLALCALLALTLLPAPAYAATFTQPTSGTELAQWLLAPNADVTITGTPVYTGAPSACSLFNAIDLGTIGEDHFALPAGILLTSGDGTPPESNTSGSFGWDNGMPGDADVKTHADLGFATFDAAALEFSFTVPADTPAVEFLFMFGSDEYAEYKDSDYVDGAIVLVDGVNYAMFSNGQPLKVISDAEMVTNNNALSIEYDGISAPKRIVGLLNQSLTTHTIKIAIADTSDGGYDSGLFLSAMKVSHETSGGISQAGKNSDATVSSSSYTVAQSRSAGSISLVPAGTDKAAFLANIARGYAVQTWNTDGLQDPVQEGDTLVVTAEDETTTITYAIHLAYAVSVGMAEHGTANADKSLAAPGDTVTLTAAPDSGYHLEEWQISPALSIVNNQFTMPNEAVTVTPVFELSNTNATVASSVYTVSEDGGTGEISGVPDGTTAAAFLANLAKGHDAQTWNTDGLHDPVQEGDTLAVTAEDGTTIVTYTIHLAYAVSIGTAEHGTANADKSLAAPGDTVTLTAAPDSGYHLKEWQISPLLSITGNRFVMPAEAVSVTPVFEANDAAIRAVEAKIDALPDPAAAGDQDILDAQDDILDAKKAYDALSGDDRPGVDPVRVDKLDKLITRLTALLIIVPESNGVSAEGIGAAVLVPELSSPDTGRVVVELAAEPASGGGVFPNFAVAEQALADSGQRIVSGYDLSLIKTVFDGGGAQLSRETVPASSISGSITVLLPVPAGYGDGAGLTVVYIDDDGNVTALPTTPVMVNGVAYLQFTTTHFSLYGIVANIPKHSGLSDGYPQRTLTDEDSGLTVSGAISADASLRVKTLSGDAGGAFGDAVRQRTQAMADTLYLAAEVSLTHDYSGGFTLAFPVGGQYEGQNVTLLQYVGGKLKTFSATVQNGTASFRVTGLGSIALFVPVQAIDPMTIPKTGGAPQPLALFPILLAFAGMVWIRREKIVRKRG